MEPEPPEEKSVDEVLDEIDWEKLGVKPAQGKSELPLPAQTEFPPPDWTYPALPAAPEPVPPAAPEPALPATTEPVLYAEADKMQLFSRGSDIEIVRRWFGWETVLGTAAVLFGGWVVFAWYPNLGRSTELEDTIWFPLFVAGLVGGVYYVLAGWLNRTHIVVSRGKITVRHRPIPWVGNKEIDAADLEQLYIEEHEHRSGKGGTRITYDVHAILSNDRSTKLVDGLRSSEQAYFVEHQIEQYLGIKDTM